MAASLVHVQDVVQYAGYCILVYQDLGSGTLSSVAGKLQQFADTLVKRHKDKYLDDALQLLKTSQQVLSSLTEADIIPLLRCIITCQISTCSVSSSFHRLEKIISKLAEIRPQLVSQELGKSLCNLVQNEEVLQLKDLQIVCMYLEGSPIGREFFRQHLVFLLKITAVTLSAVMKDQTTQNVLQSYMAVKMCFQIFRELPEKIASFVWTSILDDNNLKGILESLVQIIAMQSVSRDTRLMAGTALASLANTSPVPEVGAQDILNLVLWRREVSGNVRFGELALFDINLSLDRFGLLALIRGLLTCGHPDLLICEVSSSAKSHILLEHLLSPVAYLCQAETEHYYSFQVFCLWLQRVREQITEILQKRQTGHLLHNGDTLCQVNRLLWTCAEMPVEGTADLVLRCFQHFLHIHHTECHLSESSEDTLHQEMLQRITETSWQSRSRYSPLCALLQFMGPMKVLALYPQLPCHLYHCLSINYLCPAASETYRIILTLQRAEWLKDRLQDEGKLAQLWSVTWLPHLCNALSSRESSLQNNAATHLLPTTLRCFPESSSLIADQLKGAELSQLRGWMSLVRGQKMVSGQVGKNGVERLRLCLKSADDNVRLSALSYLCCSPRSSQPPSVQEIELLMEFLPFNLSCDNAGFRQQLQTVLRKALERMRDGALTALRKGCSQEENLTKAVDFLEWLLQLSVSSLSPVGNYQRHCSALLILCALLETCTDCWIPQKKKGQPPKDLSILLNHAKQQGCWDFFSAPIMQALVGCMQDSTNEIRDMASDLLVRFFPPIPEPVTQALFELGQMNLCNPRVPVAEAGALIMKTLLQRPDAVVLFPGKAPNTALSFLTCLVEMLKDHFQCARENLLKAATFKPLHGVLSATRLCLLEVPAVLQSLSHENLAPSWCCLLKDLVSTLQEVTSFILSVLYGSIGAKPPDAPAPSFADMGKAVSALIARGQGLEELQGAILLSEEHSLIMTCCWVSLKEIGVLLGPLVEKLLSVPAVLLPLITVKESVATYQDIFLRCRHWGAVDGCSTGFTKLCSALLCHEDSKLRDIPREIMEQALVESQSQNSLSVTRRGAGFPVLLQCILNAEGPQRPLLESCVSSLLELAEKPLPSEWDQTRDLPQVSAVHALQTMLHSAGLRMVLLSHAVPMMSLALRSLRSGCWAMRNAALQLFSALAGSMLGLSRSDSDHSVQSTLSVATLLKRFPGLQDVLLKELYSGLCSGTTLHPTLHPTLTLLARLHPGGNSEASYFVKPLLDLAGNPLYAVRVMAARALVPVVQMADYHTLLFELVGKLPSANERISHNALHGHLLQLQALLTQAMQKCLPEDVEQELAQRLHSALWLISPAQRCPLVSTTFLEVLSLLGPTSRKVCSRQVWEAVCEELLTEKEGAQVGSAVFHEACVLYFCNEIASSCDPNMHAKVCHLLQTCNQAVLKWLNKQTEIHQALGETLRHTLQDMLYPVLLSHGTTESLKLFLESYNHLHNICSQPSSPQNKNLQSAKILLTMLESSQGGPKFRGQLLCTLSLLIAHSALLEDLSLVSQWLSAMLNCSHPALSCEELRLAAAQAMQLAGVHLVKQALRRGSLDLQQLAVRTIVCAVDLLQDEDRCVREVATRFAVGVLDLPAGVTLQSDQAILHLLHLLRDDFCNCVETFNVLLLRLPPFDLQSALCDFQDRSISLYEQDEPNVFADSMFLSSLLLPVLMHLVGSLSNSTSHHTAVLQWVTITAPVISYQIQHLKSWWKEQGSVSTLWLRAVGCSQVHAAILGLQIRGELLLSALENLSSSGVEIAHLDLTHDTLREELLKLQSEFRLRLMRFFVMDSPD
ncbi:thyroid adenoma-associated protein homolog [Bombina bombina]|uniref:thyroid adenoma-associated protein homolog n=1 Tax=Bombina bombina TaxID=8345 RepID=UPI00235B1FE0|nr:thyroid adenoma-associated protein homolog [Bombina bombina]